MGNLFSRKHDKNPNRIPIPDFIKEFINHMEPCCGKSDLRHDSNKKHISCSNCFKIVHLPTK
jgi:hypothetical protein